MGDAYERSAETTLGAPSSTRERILRAAVELLTTSGAGRVTMAGVARASGVSRQGVYLNFESRASLLSALVRHLDDSLGFTAAVDQARRLPPVEAFTALVHAWCDHLPRIYPVAAELLSAGQDENVAVAERLSGLHGALHAALSRVQDNGALAPAWTVEAAADWAWALSHVTSWQHLVEERGWPAAAFRDQLLHTLTQQLLISTGTGRRAGLAEPGAVEALAW
ncbi:TetR/AcrR family transcriptional regulator [Pseudonocardia sp. NPDC049154]|uniref:TetR/AcrR family transcriptional regulator n=1 Tax=Pseudonocardia sp. NPDC049154 TaxID=3155501 RepID=UPI0033F38661